MEIKEAIKMYDELKNNKEIISNIDKEFFLRFAETVLKELEDSISKDKIREKIEEIDKKAGESIGTTYYKQDTK